MFTKNVLSESQENVQVLQRKQGDYFNFYFTGEVPSESSLEVEDRNGEESDDEGRGPKSPDMFDPNIVTPSNFDSHMAAQPTHSNIPVQRLVQSVRQVI